MALSITDDIQNLRGYRSHDGGYLAVSDVLVRMCAELIAAQEYTVDLSLRDFTIKVTGVYEITDSDGGENVLNLPDPILFPAGEIVLVNSGSTFATYGTHAPYVSGTVTPFGSMTAGTMIVLKSVNGKWRGAEIS